MNEQISDLCDRINDIPMEDGCMVIIGKYPIKKGREREKESFA